MMPIIEAVTPILEGDVSSDALTIEMLYEFMRTYERDNPAHLFIRDGKHAAVMLLLNVEMESLEFTAVLDLITRDRVRHLRDVAAGPCSGMSQAHTCIEVGSSDTGPFCSRCKAKETLQGICRDLQVVGAPQLRRLQRQLVDIHEKSKVDIGAAIPPYGGWT